MNPNSNTVTTTITTLSIVRKENQAMKVVPTSLENIEKNSVKQTTMISSKGYIRVPKHDYL
ncbi:hypothetical protein LZZ85_04575 [Terrimonas sp. NA20]|uniref:Uncharacterized protein n=1 Tax=Terrimonas ginsenosidimutans TaxID=2908004 RepID=A0ABS9KML0_9BACT|nr:hypothetical protein [Terrimonas ginsenosidimutans]MCG2613539.1 hypothetical protein [Terrimonas ginsenosidimutans]